MHTDSSLRQVSLLLSPSAAEALCPNAQRSAGLFLRWVLCFAEAVLCLIIRRLSSSKKLLLISGSHRCGVAAVILECCSSCFRIKAYGWVEKLKILQKSAADAIYPLFLNSIGTVVPQAWCCRASKTYLSHLNAQSAYRCARLDLEPGHGVWRPSGPFSV